FTDRGKIQVSVSPVEGGEGVEIEVKDTGVGIPKESMPFIFEPFRQVEGAFTRSHGGVGLGLNIVKKLLNLLHGRVEVESEVGKGSTFHITIPAKYSA
ncbi:MAG: sensor histidine kinase, partial [Dehalococcoidia bacterium]